MSTQRSKVDRLAGLFGSPAGSPELKLGPVSVSELAQQVSTPFYAYSGDMVANQLRRVQHALGPETDVYYSLKANPSLGVCQVIGREGAGAEVASAGELLLARKAGFSPDKIIFAGPGKTEDELTLAVEMGILSINAESPGEISRVAAIAARLKKPARIGLRVNPAEAVQGAQMRMGGGAQQFGFDEEMLPEVLDRFGSAPYLSIAGVHVYAGSQMFDTAAILANCQKTSQLARQIAARLERPLETADFGGGFGVPYFENSPEFDLEGFGTGYRGLVSELRKDPLLAKTRLIVELGRYIVAEAGVYVTRVVDTKSSRGKTFVVTDGGMNHHITATGNFGQVFRKSYPVAVLNRMSEPAAGPVSVVGPCCTPLDVICQNQEMPVVKVGDLIGIFYSGAYGYSASSLGFLSHPTPAEVLVWKGQTAVLRTAGRADQVLDGQKGLAL